MRPKKNNELSQYARFHIALRGYDLLLKGRNIDKWEAWAHDYKSAERIINNENSRIKAVLRNN